jgi:hypothetical protein
MRTFDNLFCGGQFMTGKRSITLLLQECISKRNFLKERLKLVLMYKISGNKSIVRILRGPSLSGHCSHTIRNNSKATSDKIQGFTIEGHAAAPRRIPSSNQFSDSDRHQNQKSSNIISRMKCTHSNHTQ